MLDNQQVVAAFSMLDYLPLESSSESDVMEWFAGPRGHFSDAGAAVYAEAMRTLLREYLPTSGC
jgi:hypothetical protein